MEPIISPWFIYFLSIADGLLLVFFVGAAIFGVVAVVTTILAVNWRIEYDEEDEDYLKAKATLKWSLKFLIPLVVLSILMPSKNTIIGIYVAKNITHDSAEKILDAGKSIKEELKSDVMDLINALQNDDKKKEN
jgi:hypothetical protein